MGDIFRRDFHPRRFSALSFVSPLATLLLLLLLITPLRGSAQPLSPQNRQLILVVSPGWTSTKATLRLYRKRANRWQLEPITQKPWLTLMGRSGLAWGLANPPRSAPQKHEGDGKSPAGTFGLITAFGDPREKPTGGFPFLSLNPDWVGVDDPKSVYYNQIVDTAKMDSKDWKTWEHMWNSEYKLGLQVAYNTEPVVPGKGSLIFMHIFSQPPAPTSGCTSMSTDHIRALCNWLRADEHPVLVQLPAGEYERVRAAWGLP